VSNVSNASNEYYVDFLLQDFQIGDLDIFLGVTYLNQRSDLTINQLTQSFDSSDPDGFNYSRVSTYTDVKETLHFKSLGARFGCLLPPLWKNLQFKGYFAFYPSPQFDFNNRTIAFHEGYYEDLFGITIDENQIYDYGLYSSGGNGSLSSLSSQFDFGLNVVYDLNIKESVQNGYNIIVRPSAGIIRRSFSFSNDSNQIFEVNSESINSSTIFIDKMDMVMVKVGFAVCIQQVPKALPCP
jgi:hypothetical protein